MTPKEQDSYAKIIHQLVSSIQVLVYRREALPILGREEVRTEIMKKLNELQTIGPNGKDKWRRVLLELAAYALYAAVADE